MDADRIEEVFRRRRAFAEILKLERIARVGVSVDVGPSGTFDQELKYANHSSVRTFLSYATETTIGGVVEERARVFPISQARKIQGPRISPVGVVEEKEK